MNDIMNTDVSSDTARQQTDSNSDTTIVSSPNLKQKTMKTVEHGIALETIHAPIFSRHSTPDEVKLRSRDHIAPVDSHTTQTASSSTNTTPSFEDHMASMFQMMQEHQLYQF